MTLVEVVIRPKKKPNFQNMDRCPMNICNTIVANINAEEELRDHVHQVEHSCGEFSGYSTLPTEDPVTEINIGTNEELHPILVSQNNEELLAYTLFLKEFRDVFAWLYTS